MHLKKLVIMAALTTLSLTGPVFAQNGNPEISAVTLQVVPGQGGGESVVTPRGMVVPLPGPGVNSNSVQIFMGSQGGYWYVDRNGQNVDLTAAVERFRQMSGQMGNMAPQTQVPQYAAAPPVNVYNEQAPSNNSSSGSGVGSTLVTATAAGLGAMAGSAMTNSYYNNGYYHGVPYGTPVYYPHGGTPYYRGAGGNTVNVDRTYNGGNNTANVNNGDINREHANAFQKQQDWYANQQRQNPSQFQNWQKSAGGDNPFVARNGGQASGQDGGRRGLFNRGGDSSAGTNAGGRFNRGADANAGTNAGGRFNRGSMQAEPQAGGRFGNASGGGRFGGRRGR